MPVIYQDWILRKHLRANPEWLYLFGDNSLRKGYGGQAAEMRGEPNAVGITTKKRPSMVPSAFFNDTDYAGWLLENEQAMWRVEKHLYLNGTVVLPKSPLGSGYARLEQNAPRIWMTLVAWCNSLQNIQPILKVL